MAKAIHTMIRVRDEERSLVFYREAFGLQIAQRVDFDTFSLIYLANPETEFELELTVNRGTAEPYDLGNGYGHMAFSVEDLDAEHARFTAAGLNPDPLKELVKDGFSGRYFFVSDPDGYRIEVLARGGRFR
ncbi:MAG: VOC family protein [Thermoleophilia bacterium]|nr:VOC family protein [Thermoleophilia bacterium]